MVMIPTDVGVQVRAQTEPGPGPVRAIAEIPSDLPELQQGQVFRARIQEVLPENTYKALVAGRSLTLSLPEGAKAGDTLELVVIDRTPRAIVAQAVQSGTTALGDSYHQARLSTTGQLIAALLPREGDSAAPVALTRGRPVLAQVPASAAEIARSLPSQLAQAVGSSGLFYEAHQVQWALGQWPRSRLLAEPQGEYSRDGPRAAWRPIPEEALPQESALAARRGAANPGQSAPTVMQTLFGGGTTASVVGEETSQQANQAAARTIPEDLRPLVQQQLEAAATQRVAWHGEIWPKQEMDWEIRRDAPQRGDPSGEEPAWNTNLRLTLPRLGEIDARVQLSGQTLRLDLRTGRAASEADLRLALPLLQQALATAGLNLLDAKTSHGQG